MIVIFTGMMVLSKVSSGFVMSFDIMEPDIIWFAFIEYQSHNLKAFPWIVLLQTLEKYMSIQLYLRHQVPDLKYLQLS